VISVALRTPLKTRLGILIKLHFRIIPIAILVLHQVVPPTFYNKIAPMIKIDISNLDQNTLYSINSQSSTLFSNEPKNFPPQPKT